MESATMVLFNYKKYRGRLVSIDTDDGMMHGEVVGINDVVTFQAESVTEFERAFKESIDDYLEFCQERDEKPEKPYSGRFVVRIIPELHREIAIAAELKNVSINQWVTDQLARAVSRATNDS